MESTWCEQHVKREVVCNGNSQFWDARVATEGKVQGVQGHPAPRKSPGRLQLDVQLAKDSVLVQDGRRQRKARRVVAVPAPVDPVVVFLVPEDVAYLLEHAPDAVAGSRRRVAQPEAEHVGDCPPPGLFGPLGRRREVGGSGGGGGERSRRRDDLVGQVADQEARGAEKFPGPGDASRVVPGGERVQFGGEEGEHGGEAREQVWTDDQAVVD